MNFKHVSDVVEELRSGLRRLMRKRWVRPEPATLPPTESGRSALDLRLGARELRNHCCSNLGHSALLPERLQLLGIDPEFVKRTESTTYRDLARACASCKAWQRCARDLAQGDIQAGMDGYCLNGPAIDALMVGPDPRSAS